MNLNISCAEIKRASGRLKKRGEHKGQNGRVLVVGGSLNLGGAAYLAGMAALRTGVDLSIIACPRDVGFAINELSPDLITMKLDGDFLALKHYSSIMDMAKSANSVLIGPGICRNKGAGELAKKLVESLDKPLMIDADALKVTSLKNVKNAILTPHEREFQILLENSGIKEKDLQKHLSDNIVLRKGKIDRIYSNSKVLHNKTGNSGMAVGGTGDVLAGICAGLVAQGVSLYDAACYAAYHTGSIGDKLLKESGYGFIASDFLERIQLK